MRTRFFCFLIAALLLLPASAGFAEEAYPAAPGDQLDLTFTVTANPNQAIGATLKLEYDHDAFELIPSASVRNDAPLISLDMNGIAVGVSVAASFRVKEQAKKGEYEIRIRVEQAGDINEQDVDGLAFSSCLVRLEGEQEAFAMIDGGDQQETAEKYQALVLHLYQMNGMTPDEASPEEDFQFTVINQQARVTKYVGKKTNVVIPPLLGGWPVTSIGSNAFFDNQAVQSVSIPLGVVSIGESAFKGCTGLKRATLRAGLAEIGNSAFSGCAGLVEMEIPDGVQAIEYYTFYGCERLVRVKIPSSVSAIGSNAFFRCKSLHSLVIPDAVSSIGKKTFAECAADFILSVAKDGYAQAYCQENGIPFETR